MDGYACPKGHQSAEPDFCSDCGAKIQGATALPAKSNSGAPETGGATAHAVEAGCPDCGAGRAADGSKFCEVCGYNFDTGAHGEVPVLTTAEPAAAPLPQPWTVVVGVDPSLREPGSPDPPAGMGPFTIKIDKPFYLIGRTSEARGIFPDIPLNFDDAVSHRHALLERRADGVLVLRDIGAANGTRLNGQDVEAMADNPLRDGDEITVGHWTRITVKAVS